VILSTQTIGNGFAVINAAVVDKRRKVTMLYHIALDINYNFGFVETCQTIQTEVRGDMPWHEAVEQEINSLKSNLAGLDLPASELDLEQEYGIELRWVKEYADA